MRKGEEPKMEEKLSFVARVKTNYRITVPKPVRDALDLKEQEIVQIHIRKIKRPNKNKGGVGLCLGKACSLS